MTSGRRSPYRKTKLYFIDIDRCLHILLRVLYVWTSTYNICTSSYIKYIDVVLDMGPHRAPGLDGFTAVFYQRFWEDLKPEIMKEISDFFERGEFDKQHNHTNLCLIPKIYPPIGMTEF